MAVLSPLAFLHPSGIPARVRAAGSGMVPRALRGSHLDGEGPELVLLAPGAEEMRSRRAFDALVAVARAAGQDALVVIIGARSPRSALLAALQASGFVRTQEMLVLPSTELPRQLTTLGQRPLAMALAGSGGRAWVKRVSQRIVALPLGRRLIGRFGPGMAVLLQRAPARALAQWTTAGAAARSDDDLLLVLSWHARGTAAVVHRFDPQSGARYAVVKIGAGSTGSRALEREHEALQRLGAAASAGARIPEVIGMPRAGDSRALALRTLEGDTAAALLAAGALTPSEALHAVAGWLLRWSKATIRHEPRVARGLLDTLLHRAERLAPSLVSGDRYLDWLRTRFGRISSVPLVAVHGDLTMWNIIWKDGAAPGVVDWESAAAEGLPLTDLAYAAVDARQVARRESRAAAFIACFADHRDPATSAELRALGEACRLSREEADACLHASWIHHAGNEAAAGGSGPFHEILELLAAAPERYTAWRVT